MASVDALKVVKRHRRVVFVIVMVGDQIITVARHRAFCRRAAGSAAGGCETDNAAHGSLLLVKEMREYIGVVAFSYAWQRKTSFEVGARAAYPPFLI